MGCVITYCKITPIIEKNEQVGLIIDSFIQQDLQGIESEQNLLLGSSSIANLNVELSLCSSKWLNRGIGNSIIDDVINYLDNTRLVLLPQKILLYVGENDISTGADPKVLLVKVKYLVSMLKVRFPSAQIIFLAIKPSPARVKFWLKFDEFNELVKKEFEAMDEVHFLQPNWTLDTLNNEAVFKQDGIHLTLQGYKVFLEGVSECIEI